MAAQIQDRSLITMICQVFQVYYFYYLFLIGPFTMPFIVLVLLFTPFAWLSLLYIGWAVYYHRQPYKVPKPWEWYRNHPFWDHYGDYFPVNLHKTAELPADKNYLLIWHPHGILGFSAGVTLMTNRVRFTEKFPGITRYAGTLNLHFLFPLRAWYLGIRGFIPVSFDCLVQALSRKDGGNAVIVAVGGAEESFESHKGNYKLCLLRRKEFCRVALKTGASLVPVYAFGETATYYQVPNPVGSRLRTLQEYIKRTIGVAPVLIVGKLGFFNIPGPFPYRTEINTVVGSPILVEKVENPTKEQIEELHQKYKDHLIELFEAHKERFGASKDDHLEFY